MRLARLCRLPPLLLAAGLAAVLAACAREANNPPPINPLAEIREFRARKEAFLRNDPQSPFRAAPPAAYAPLKYFEPDASWIFQSKLRLDPSPKVFSVRDTKGQPRRATLFGQLTFVRDGRTFSLNVYGLDGPVRGTYLYAIWFTDRTTGGATYEVGRYLDFQKDEDPDYVYTIDFNRAYNPYCAYTSAFACPIPRTEDRLDLAVTAGEKKWHE